MLSLVIPLYRSEPNLPRLFTELEKLSARATDVLEVVFVDDGSPDRCGEIVEDRLRTLPFRAQFVRLSRNFGAFAAIAAGLQAAQGDYFAVIAADLQEPPELVLEFLEKMRSGEADVVFGVRESRQDPLSTRAASEMFWWLYRHLVNPEIPPGGVDVFGCNRQVRDQVCSMGEVESSLIGLLFWVGFRRAFVSYHRQARQEGKSAWTLSKKLRYLMGSVFSFTDLPIRMLLLVGASGAVLAVLGALTVLVARLSGLVQVPGYSPIIIAILFFGAITALGLGITGQYIWLCLQNARKRPAYIVRTRQSHGGDVNARRD